MRAWLVSLLVLAACGPAPVPKAGVVPDALADGWQVGAPGDVGIRVEGIAELERLIDDGRLARPDSLIIVRHGVLVYERYFDGDRDDRRDLRSATKSITSILVGIAQDKGRLSVDTPAAQLLPRYGALLRSEERKSRITPRHLLEMSSGLDCDDWSKDSPGNEERMYDSKDWVEFIAKLPSRDSPGTRLSYCTGGVVMLGAMLGDDVPMLARDWLFAPLGIERADWQKASGGHTDTGGHLHLRTRDFAKIGQLVLKHGVWNGAQVVSSAWVEASLSPGPILGDSHYGYLWWWNVYNPTETDHFQISFARGNGGQILMVIPGLDMVIAVTGSHFNDPAQDEPLAWIGRYLVPAAL